jgi:branched-subunit amino acid ABC-type transport system permease component
VQRYYPAQVDALDVYTEETWVAARLFVEAVRRLGTTPPTTRSLVDSLNHITNWDNGLTMPLTFRPGVHDPNHCLQWIRNQQGVWHTYSGWNCFCVSPPVIASLSGFSLLPSYTVIGLTLGGVYALAATGLVLIYRVSGVLNFAHGAVAMFSTFVAYQISVVAGIPSLIGLLAAVATGAALGFVIEFLTIRPLTGRPPLTKVAVTIAWLLVLQTAAGLIWGSTGYHRPVQLVSSNGFTVPLTNVVVGYDQLTIFLVAVGLSLGTSALLRWTSLGAQMRAVADDPQAARLWGIDVDRVSAASWMIGSGMAAVAGVLITPLLNFDTYSLTVLVIDAFTAALIGRLTNLPMTVVGAILLGLVQYYPKAFFNQAGLSELSTFVLALITLAVVFRPGLATARGRM